MSFAPRFTISNPIAAALTRIERARGFIEAAKLSEEWIRRMGARALALGTRLSPQVQGTRDIVAGRGR
jgi:hypothetical protein